MANFIGITSYLREKVMAAGGDPLRETLSLVRTRDGRDCCTDGSGKVWRLTPFIENMVYMGIGDLSRGIYS